MAAPKTLVKVILRQLLRISVKNGGMVKETCINTSEDLLEDTGRAGPNLPVKKNTSIH